MKRLTSEQREQIHTLLSLDGVRIAWMGQDLHDDPVVEVIDTRRRVVYAIPPIGGSREPQGRLHQPDSDEALEAGEEVDPDDHALLCRTQLPQEGGDQ